MQNHSKFGNSEFWWTETKTSVTYNTKGFGPAVTTNQTNIETLEGTIKDINGKQSHIQHIVCVGDRTEYCFIRVGELIKRIKGGGKTVLSWKYPYEDLEKDFDAVSRGEAVVKAYNPDGTVNSNPRFLQDYHKKLENLGSYKKGKLEFRVLARESIQNFFDLTESWVDILNQAKAIVKLYTKTINENIFDSRFFAVPDNDRPVKFSVWTTKPYLQRMVYYGSGQVSMLQKLCTQASIEKRDKERKARNDNTIKAQCEFTHLTQQEVTNKDHITISNHPLGLYCLSIAKSELNRLVGLQCGTLEYFRALPSYDQCVALDNKLKSKNAVNTRTERDGDLPSTSVVTSHKRIPTTTIMGPSANAWAENTTNGLSWAKGNLTYQYVAEWLHLIAHGSIGGASDTFENLVFGTSECNSYMLRVETLSRNIALLDEVRNKKGTMKLTTVCDRDADFTMLRRNGTFPGFNLKDVAGATTTVKKQWMTSRSWLVGAIGYQTTITFNNRLIPHVETSTMYFCPFSRLVSLRWEPSLDSNVADEYDRYVKSL